MILSEDDCEWMKMEDCGQDVQVGMSLNQQNNSFLTTARILIWDWNMEGKCWVKSWTATLGKICHPE